MGGLSGQTHITRYVHTDIKADLRTVEVAKDKIICLFDLFNGKGVCVCELTYHSECCQPYSLRVIKHCCIAVLGGQRCV